jgi:hypothetical protein
MYEKKHVSCCLVLIESDLACAGLEPELPKREFGVSLLYEEWPESKDTSRVGRNGKFCSYCGNIVVDLEHLPVSRARLTMVKSALFE